MNESQTPTANHRQQTVRSGGLLLPYRAFFPSMSSTSCCHVNLRVTVSACLSVLPSLDIFVSHDFPAFTQAQPMERTFASTYFVGGQFLHRGEKSKKTIRIKKKERSGMVKEFAEKLRFTTSTTESQTDHAEPQ